MAVRLVVVLDQLDFIFRRPCLRFSLSYNYVYLTMILVRSYSRSTKPSINLGGLS